MIGDRWGVSPTEVARRYPCDDLAPTPAVEAWRGVTIDAPPARVWPWVMQIRLAPYSYDLIDNLGRRSPRDLRELPPPEPGQPFTAVGGRPQGEIVSVDPPHHYTGRILGGLMSYVVVPEGGRTRLLLKVVLERPTVLAPLLCVGDLVMARRQLLNLKQLAESSQD